MKKILKNTILLQVIFICCSIFLLKTVSNAETDDLLNRNVEVFHLDNYNVPIKETEMYSGQVGETITLQPANLPYFTASSSNVYTYTITDSNTQTVILRYTNKQFQAPNTYMSMFFDTEYTYTGFINSEYGGNLAFFNLVEDESIRAIYTTSFGNIAVAGKIIAFEIDFPASHKFSLTDKMMPRIFVQTNSAQVLPIEMMSPDYEEGKLDFNEYGIRTEYWASIDNGDTYINYNDLSETQSKLVTNVVGRVYFSQSIFSDSNQRAYLVADLPIRLLEENLNEDELAGNVPISGWRYRNNIFPRDINLDTKIFIQNPIISGHIKTNNEKNWQTSAPLSNHKVKLIMIDSEGEESTVAETVTDSNGYYFFHNEIKSFNNIKIEVLNLTNHDSYFYYIDTESQEPSFLETNYISIGNLPDILVSTVNNIYSWYKQPNGNSFAEASRSLNFLLVEDELTIETYQVNFESNGGSVVAPISNIEKGTMIKEPANPTREGHIFKGWYRDNETFKEAWDFDIDNVTSNITLYAKWEVSEESLPNEPIEPTEPTLPTMGIRDSSFGILIIGLGSMIFGIRIMLKKRKC